ncbi:hypothetical protein OEA41_007382 [Lepraria neglecta]|uniref:Uncharacterized protein n=1 Tax=Lepraria neglecta TaxID=209136 RepID=A0AAD9ZDI4_9LECA|nr:hypothetical protein OEA41_007382 [Lepraria neglecta]
MGSVVNTSVTDMDGKSKVYDILYKRRYESQGDRGTAKYVQGSWIRRKKFKVTEANGKKYYTTCDLAYESNYPLGNDPAFSAPKFAKQIMPDGCIVYLIVTTDLQTRKRWDLWPYVFPNVSGDPYWAGKTNSKSWGPADSSTFSAKKRSQEAEVEEGEVNPVSATKEVSLATLFPGGQQDSAAIYRPGRSEDAHVLR